MIAEVSQRGPEDADRDRWIGFSVKLEDRSGAQGVAEEEEGEYPDEPVGADAGVSAEWLWFGCGLGHGIGLLGVRGEVDVSAMGLDY